MSRCRLLSPLALASWVPLSAAACVVSESRPLPPDTFAAASDDACADLGAGCGEGCGGIYEPPVCGCGGECECEADRWEPNDGRDSAALLPWQIVDEVGAYLEAGGFLCAGESDWYLAALGGLEHGYEKIAVAAYVNGDFCACEGHLPEAAEHAIAVEVYDAGTLQLLASEVAADGHIQRHIEVPARDVLIRIHGPTAAATYEYGLHVVFGAWNWGDDCEC